MTQAHIYYSGMVQGVGFRFSVQRYAAEIGNLTGWVRNISDGRVEILVEGAQTDINKLMKAIESHFEGYIHRKDVNYNQPAGQYLNFTIKFTAA